MNTYFRWIALAALLFSANSMAVTRIGVTMMSFDDMYLADLRDYVANKAKAEGVQVQFEDARLDVVKQISQVQDFLNQGVDAVIVNPVDTAATRAMSEAADKAGIPLVFMNRKPDDPKLPEHTAVVVSDDIEAGRLQAQYIVDKLGGKGNVAILMGELTSNAARFRTEGNKLVLSKYPGIKIVEQQTGYWQREKAMDITNNWLVAGVDFNAILANNDEMAIGAAMALRQAGRSDVLIGGVDGTVDARAAMKRNLISVTVFQDAKGQAEKSVEAALKMIGKQPATNILIPYRLVTPENYTQFEAGK